MEQEQEEQGSRVFGGAKRSIKRERRRIIMPSVVKRVARLLGGWAFRFRGRPCGGNKERNGRNQPAAERNRTATNTQDKKKTIQKIMTKQRDERIGKMTRNERRPRTSLFASSYLFPFARARGGQPLPLQWMDFSFLVFILFLGNSESAVLCSVWPIGQWCASSKRIKRKK